MTLIVYEELYQTPFRICLGVLLCKDISCLNPIKSNHNKYNDLQNNPLPNIYLLKNHQSRTVVNRITKVSLQGLEKRAQNQEAKRIRLGNDILISGLLKVPIQSKRSQKRRRGRQKYLNHRTQF